MSPFGREPGAALLLVCAVAACSHAGAPAPPVYPHPGFGRAGCYAGPGLRRMYSGDPRAAAEAAARGPWLILDSLAVGEHGWTDPRNHPGTLVQPRDSLERTFGSWTRVARDSIVFTDGSMYPGVVWHFRKSIDGLGGMGVLEHDVIVRGRDGVDRPSVSRWPVYLVRIDCKEVPVP